MFWLPASERSQLWPARLTCSKLLFEPARIRLALGRELLSKVDKYHPVIQNRVLVLQVTDQVSFPGTDAEVVIDFRTAKRPK